MRRPCTNHGPVILSADHRSGSDGGRSRKISFFLHPAVKMLCSNSMPANGRCLDYIQVSKRRPIVALRFSAGFSDRHLTRQVPYRDDPPISEINLNSLIWLVFEKGMNTIMGIIVQQRWCVPSLLGLININTLPFAPR